MSESHPFYHLPGKQASSSSKKTLHNLNVTFKTVVALDDSTDKIEVKEILHKNIRNILDDELADNALVTSLSPIKQAADLPDGWEIEGIPYTYKGYDSDDELVTIKDYLSPPIQLNNCPFCGSQVNTRKHLTSYHDDSNGATMYSIKCSNCGAGMTGTSQSSVVIRWNKRDN